MGARDKTVEPTPGYRPPRTCKYSDMKASNVLSIENLFFYFLNRMIVAV